MRLTKVVPVNVVFQKRETSTGPEWVFVETETPEGKGIRLGQWVKTADGRMDAIRIMVPAGEVNAEVIPGVRP